MTTESQKYSCSKPSGRNEQQGESLWATLNTYTGWPSKQEEHFPDSGARVS